MPAIFPAGGVSKDNAINTVAAPLLADGCTALYHAPRCVPKFDPAAANAVISEILNAMKCAKVAYDCNALNNLCKAIEHHGIRGSIRFDHDDNTPIDILGGNNRLVRSGSFRIPNTSPRPITVMATYVMPFQLQQIQAGAGQNVEVICQVSHANDFATISAELYMIVAGTDFVAGTYQVAHSTTAVSIHEDIPVGGKDFFFRIRSTTTGNTGDWRLQRTRQLLQIDILGVNCNSWDNLTGGD